SVIERLEDRLTIFDSATLGAGQLIYKAHLRTYKVKGLRSLIAAGGRMYDALVEQINQIRLWQSNEGLTLMDAEDTYEAHQYSFA
ncbi:phage portal protein, partial [Acinetobacter baumannii]